MRPVPPISTPCVRVCILDPKSGLCEGCGRTAFEIGRWGGMSEEQRLAIMAGLEARMEAAFADPPPGRPAPDRPEPA